jgi:hypothetical protein
VDSVWYKAQNDKFYADYCTGQLDIIAYSEFVFGFLAQHDMAYLQKITSAVYGSSDTAVSCYPKHKNFDTKTSCCR